jgi:hypothetical protein
MRIPETYTEERKQKAHDAVMKHCTPDGIMALNWDKCRPSDQFRRADILHAEVLSLAARLEQAHQAVGKLADSLHQISNS